MMTLRLKKTFCMLVLASALVLLQACKGSGVDELFRQCAPDCLEFVSPINLAQAVKDFEQVVTTVGADDSNLDGHWVMLSTKRYAFENADERSVNDVLYTRNLILTDLGNTLEVSDCYNTETYALDEQGFTIPQDSVFFSSLYFDNQDDIQVNRSSNTLLEATWRFVTLEGSESDINARLFKIDNVVATYPLGAINAQDDIYCYTYLHFYSSGERQFQQQWIPYDSEIKELQMTIDPLSGDNTVSLSSRRVNETNAYTILFNQDIDGQEYECFGDTEITNTTSDYLSFSGSFTIKTPDSVCNDINGQALGESTFSFTGL